MVQGTGSDVGKSLLVAGLCRALARRGLRPLPFKPQNMSNNAAATPDGGEIGRAQALQARACGVAPSVDMNPVLLKPQSEGAAQVVVRGRVTGVAGARDYHTLKPRLMPAVLESFHRLQTNADVVLVEGAGSPAEINLRQGDIANMGFAVAARTPVALVGDVDRGGVIAALVGTHALLPPEERALVRACVINRFRGDKSLFDGAVREIARRTGWPCAGVVPWLVAAGDLPAEDSTALAQRGGAASADSGGASGRVVIAVPRLPRLANFDDLDPLLAEPGVDLRLAPLEHPLPADAAIVILPGSKATRADLEALRAAGWDVDIRAHVRRGRPVLGLCAGYQMLGRAVSDPAGVEGAAGSTPGLGLLDVETVLSAGKIVRPARGVDVAHDLPVHGYEMHMGRTSGPDATARPMLRLRADDGVNAPDGAMSADGLVMGCHLHGLFQSDAFRAAFLRRLGVGDFARVADDRRVENALDALAAHVEAHMDVDMLLDIARAGVGGQL